MNLFSAALMFLVISVVASIFGYTRVADASSTLAKVLFFVFVVSLLLLVILGLMVLVPLMTAVLITR